MAKCYPSDLTDAEWAVLEPLLPAAKPGGRPRTTCLRQVLEAIFHVLRSGCQWRMVPKEFPPYQTVYEYFRTWRVTGVWERLHDTLRGDVRETAGRHREPSAGIIDSQTVKTTEQGGVRGYDGGKRIRGRKRYVVVDVLGLLLLVCVHSAGIQDRDGAKSVLEALVAVFPRVQLIWADGGYAGKLVDWVTTTLQRVLSIVKRPRKSGFKVLQWRWIVERTLGWLNRSRRLSKDSERLCETFGNVGPNRHDSDHGQEAGQGDLTFQTASKSVSDSGPALGTQARTVAKGRPGRFRRKAQFCWLGEPQNAPSGNWLTGAPNAAYGTDG